MRKEIDRVFTVFAAQVMVAWHLWPVRCTSLARGLIRVSSKKCRWTY